MKKQLLIICLLSIPAPASALVLQSSVLHLLDGLPYAIDGKTLFDMARLIKKMRDMLLGQLVDDVKKERVGMYTFHNKKYSIAQFVELEEKYAHDKAASAELHELLTDVKKEFIELTKPFLEKIQKQKRLILELMVESCNRRNVPTSAMLNWGETQSGHEEETFGKTLPDFVSMNRFMNELCNFMCDIFESCPKGRKQYDEIIRAQRLKH